MYTDEESKYAATLIEYYEKYDTTDLPSDAWEKLGRIRTRLGISYGRGHAIATEAAKNFETRKDSRWEEIRNMLNMEPFDNDYFQHEVDSWMEECATTEEEQMVAYYYKYLGWANVFDSVSEARQEDGYWDKSDEEKEAFDKTEKEANARMLEEIQSAIDHLDEDNFDFWICTLLTAKAERLHWIGGYENKDKHVEAVRLAIQALPFACNEDERERAKASITGKVVRDVNFIARMGGYGINGETPNALIQRRKELYAFEYDECSSREDNEEMMEISAMALTGEVERELYDKNNLDWFCNRPYHDRQFIFTVRDLDHIGGCYDDIDNIKYVFPLDELPGDITFPVGHPLPNMLYYAHPLRPMYLPFESAQLMLFYEKVHEMCRLFQCLGATQIHARCLKGNKISQGIITSSDFSISGGYKVINASGGISGKRSMLGNSESRDEMQLNQFFSPQKAPYCPDDLLWAKEDPELRTLIQQRLEGGLLEFSKKVSSYETSNLSQNQVNDVKAAFQNLMVNVSANYSASDDATFGQTTETEWEISVQFKPLDEFSDYMSPKELKAKKDIRKGKLIMDVSQFFYTGGHGIVILDTLQSDIKMGEEVIVCTDDQEFDSSIEGITMHFKMLEQGKAGDKVGLMLRGITETNIRCGTKIYKKREYIPGDGKGTMQENSFTKQNTTNQYTLTPEEEKYKEEILFCLEDNGTITEDDRKYLERKRKKFGITEERAKEIEQLTVPSLNADETEYLEIYKELASSGVLSERARRLLERERESLHISKERAKEIERLASAN